MRKLLRRPSPAMVVACLALFVASAGTSIAAKHYLITSTKQIKPSVLKQLKGAKGSRGYTGAQGTQGLKGDAGPSDAWEASSPGATDATSAPVTLSVVVPAGSYDVTGKAQEQNRDTNSEPLHCRLYADTVQLDDTYSVALPNNGATYGYGDAMNVVHAGYTTPTGTTFKLSCTSFFVTGVYVINPTLSAIKVGTLH